MTKSDMGHISQFRLILSAPLNDREVDVIVDINVFYLHPQTSWVSADVTDIELRITDHIPNLQMFCKTPGQ